MDRIASRLIETNDSWKKLNCSIEFFLNELKKSESMFLVLVGGGLAERCNIMCFVVLETCQVDNYYTIINDISKQFSKPKTNV